MKYLRKYDTDAAYTADANVRSALDGANVSQVTQRIAFEGRNTVVPMCAAVRGDIAVFDKVDGKRKVVRCRTFNAATLDSRYIVGDCVCYGQRAGKMLFVHKSQYRNQRWAQGWQVALDGIDLTTGGSFTFTATAGTIGITDLTITYAAGSTYADIVALINAHKTDAWEAHEYNNGVYLEMNYYTTGSTVTVSASSPTVTTRDITPKRYQLEYTGISEAFTTVVANNGKTSSACFVNLARAVDYMSIYGSSDTNVTLDSTVIVKLSVFTEADNPILYEKYNGDYTAYINDSMFKRPVGKGCLTGWNDNGSALAAVMYTDANGVQQPAYIAAYLASQMGQTAGEVTTGFEVGNFHLPDCDELALLVSQIRFPYDSACTDDDINYALNLLGGNYVNPQWHYWASTQWDYNTAWYTNGNGGSMTHNNRYHAYISVRGVSAF